MTKVATNLNYYLTPKVVRSNRKVKVNAKVALYDFRDYLHDLKKRTIKKDYSVNNSYLVGNIFRELRSLKDGPELKQYLKTNLCVAVDSFDQLVSQIELKEKVINQRVLTKYADLLREFVFDLKPFVELLERETDKKFIFFRGGKDFSNSAFELFKTCEALYWYPTISNQIIDKKATTNLNLFSLRQSLEIKFRRIFGVFELYNKDLNDIKLRHDFFPNFISDNLSYIDIKLPSINMTELLRIYNWTNYTIHNAVNPRIWQINYAIKICGSIFAPGQYKRNDDKNVLSIYASIKIKNNDILTNNLIESIYEFNDKKIFCFDNVRQEAITDEK
ncbi:MAG: hypothetical protein K8H85_00775 [Cyclobacteriaceae bacterium]|nr:hypothetical protein [Cyclobacteriaceae bacterium]